MRKLTGTLAAAAIASLTVFAGLSVPAIAGDLDAIKAAGVIRVGIDPGLKPYTFPDGSGGYKGADITVANMIAEDLGVKIEWVPLTSPNRVPFLQTDKADIVIATLANTPERAEIIDFSKPYSGSFVVVSAIKSVNVSKLEDLSGKDVGLTRGTTFDKIITEQAPKDTNIIRFDAEDTTLTALSSGQVDIGVHNIAVLVNLQEMAPAREFEAKFVLQEVKFSIGVQKGASALVAYLDGFIAAHHADGSLNAAFKEYLGRDLPPSVTAP